MSREECNGSTRRKNTCNMAMLCVQKVLHVYWKRLFVPSLKDFHSLLKRKPEVSVRVYT